MNSSQQVSAITPALAKNVSFSDKVAVVDKAMMSRSAVQKQIKEKWAAVVQVLTKYEVSAPRRRVDADAAAALVRDITVYKPKPEVEEDWEAILDSDLSYHFRQMAESSNTVRLVNGKLRGLRKFLDDFSEAKALRNQVPQVDEEKTKAARDEYAKAVAAYIEALESYDETVTSVANVKEYIGIMKDIAGISAIAQGVQAKE